VRRKRERVRERTILIPLRGPVDVACCFACDGTVLLGIQVASAPLSGLDALRQVRRARCSDGLVIMDVFTGHASAGQHRRTRHSYTDFGRYIRRVLVVRGSRLSGPETGDFIARTTPGPAPNIRHG
jgi:hypothetical protein